MEHCGQYRITGRVRLKSSPWPYNQVVFDTYSRGGYVRYLPISSGYFADVKVSNEIVKVCPFVLRSHGANHISLVDFGFGVDVSKDSRCSIELEGEIVHGNEVYVELPGNITVTFEIVSIERL